MQFFTHEASPSKLYKLLIGCVVPRPIAWVSSQSPSSTLNIAPFSFFMAVSDDPPTLAISIGNDRRNGQIKDTAHNIESTGEFVVNVVSEDLAAAMNLTATEFDSDVDEFEIAGLTPARSMKVAPPRILEAPISMECRRTLSLSVGRGPHRLVLGEILCFHVRDDLYDNSTGRIDMRNLKPIARMAGHLYSRSDVFELTRPEVDYTG